MKWIRIKYIDINKKNKEMLVNPNHIKYLFAIDKKDIITGTDYIVHGLAGDLYMTADQFEDLEDQLNVKIPIWDS